MKKIQTFIVAIVLATIISCSAETQIVEDTSESSQTFLKINETPEMVVFKNALSELTRAKVSEQAEKGYVTSLFDAKNQDILIDPAKTLLISSGYKSDDLKKLDNRIILQIALKVYAQKTQLQLIK